MLKDRNRVRNLTKKLKRIWGVKRKKKGKDSYTKIGC